MPEYRPIHSDFLIHWTGKDIDLKHPVAPHDFSKPNKAVDDLYLERLKSILRYGLWMNKDASEATMTIGGKTISRPVPSRTCFTELRLSQVRHHASKFGRLGIGFKRFFLFDRKGAPMIYHMENRSNWYVPASATVADYSLTFLKPMSEHLHGRIHYSYFDESEWRIIYDDNIEKILKSNGEGSLVKLFKKVDSTHALWSVPGKPDYVIPIEGRWFAMIIYPSISTKVRAQANTEIQDLIEKLKPKYSDSGSSASSAHYEESNRPIEIDLDSCAHL